VRVLDILKKNKRPATIFYDYSDCSLVYDSYTGITYSSLGRCAQLIHWSCEYILKHSERYIILMKN